MSLNIIIKRIIKGLVSGLLNELSPKNVCSFCNEYSEEKLCSSCKITKIEKVNVDYDEIKDNITLNVDVHKRILKDFKLHIYLVGNSTIIRKYITNIKYYDKVYIIDSIIGYIYKKRLSTWIKGYSLYLYTPSNKKAYLKRGANISKYITKKVLLSNINFSKKDLKEKILCPYTCVKNFEIKHMNKEEREEKVKIKYLLKESNRKLKLIDKIFLEELEKYTNITSNNKNFDSSLKNFKFKILLFDDVYTTGSTLDYLSDLIIKYLTQKYLEKGIRKDNIKVDYFTLVCE